MITLVNFFGGKLDFERVDRGGAKRGEREKGGEGGGGGGCGRGEVEEQTNR